MVEVKQGAWLFVLGVALTLPSAPVSAQEGGPAPPRAGSEKSERKTIFPPPPEEVLKKITHPELRAELLRMVSDDQIARSAST